MKVSDFFKLFFELFFYGCGDEREVDFLIILIEEAIFSQGIGANRSDFQFDSMLRTPIPKYAALLPPCPEVLGQEGLHIRMHTDGVARLLCYCYDVGQSVLDIIREKDAGSYFSSSIAGRTFLSGLYIRLRTHALTGDLYQSEAAWGQYIAFGLVLLQ